MSKIAVITLRLPTALIMPQPDLLYAQSSIYPQKPSYSSPNEAQNVAVLPKEEDPWACGHEREAMEGGRGQKRRKGRTRKRRTIPRKSLSYSR